MHGPYLFIGVLILIGIFLFVIKICLTGSKKGQIALPFQKEPVLFSAAERSFLGVLESALGNQFRVLGKVHLMDVIRVKSGVNRSVHQTAFNQIRSKHVDFVVCDPKDLAIQFVVELDDASHQQSSRQARDEFVDNALAAAGVPVFHFQAKHAYSVQDIRGTIFAKTAIS